MEMIVHICDLHCGVATDMPFNINVRQNFINILDEITKLKPALVVIGGDLCLGDPDIEIYNWIYGIIKEYPLQFMILPGNHDSIKMMQEAFPPDQVLQAEWQKITINDYDLIFFDTADGYLKKSQMNVIENLDSDRLALLFMHHPPLKIQVPYMDNKHAMNNIDDFNRIKPKFHWPIPIFCGHYHVEKTMLSKYWSLFVTPSLFMQIDERKEHFEVEHYRIGYRKITISENTIYTSVHYLEGDQPSGSNSGKAIE